MALMLVVLFSPLVSAAEFTIRWSPEAANTNRVAVEVTGVSSPALKNLRNVKWTVAEWQKLLAVHVEQGDLFADASSPAMVGTYRVTPDGIRFEPQFPVEPGLKYRATFHPNRLPKASGKSPMLSSTFQVPARSIEPSTTVAQIYPSADVLPENLLKFYVHFTAPMSGGHIYEHIHLRNDAGKDVELPFLEIDEELWNPNMTRLTLFIDPGRIKRGVKPLEDIGPALEEGKRYTLVIDESWKDAAGAPLKQRFVKSFRVAAADREPPDTATWK
ncbi:MAG TPA: hypothetical protein VK530_04555, partial [Candidatus Acidoferrum sp.]|nr:hypothetical protein [Candidatus Acidoferrum sp.]